MNVLRFLDWMHQRGWEVLLYGDPETRMFAEADSYGVPAKPVQSLTRNGDLLNSWRLSRRLRRDGVRWLTIHQSRDLFMGVVGRRLAGRGTRLIYSQHMHIGRNKKDPYHRWLYGQLDAFATPVQWLADRVLEKTSLPPSRLHIIPRGIELERYTGVGPDKVTARVQLDLPTDAFMLGVIGRLDPKKGQHVAIEALAKLHQEGHRVHLLLLGNRTYSEADEYAARVQAMVRERGLGDYVHFRSHHENPRIGYAALDIFLLTSKSECYGMVTIEALTSALPVIATNDGGTVSLIDHEANGLLVRPMDPDDLARALIRLIEDKDLSRRLAAEAKRRAKEKFSHHDQCRAWENLLRSLD